MVLKSWLETHWYVEGFGGALSPQKVCPSCVFLPAVCPFPFPLRELNFHLIYPPSVLPHQVPPECLGLWREPLEDTARLCMFEVSFLCPLLPGALGFSDWEYGPCLGGPWWGREEAISSRFSGLVSTVF